MQRHSGFTLIELLVTLAIVAVVARFAMPAYVSFINQQSIQAEASAFAFDLRFARSEAARLNTSVSICGSADGATCSGSWNDKRIVFADRDAGGVDTVAKSSDAPRRGVEIVANGFPTAGRLRMLPTGAPESAVSVVFCTGAGPARAGRMLSLTAIGRPNVRKTVCS